MGATYPIALFIHSWLRWAVLIGLVLVVLRSSTGRRTGVWSGLEHLTLMLAAVAFVHVGRARSKKAADAALRHRQVFAWTLTALLCVLAGIPWPFFPTPRPLFRFATGP
jgi:hypothetical protein